MGIADFFRPKHRHSDVRVRSAAVRDLTHDDAAILKQVARTDQDIGVRRIAIEKIDEADVLAELGREETERSLKELINARAAELWTSSACSADADKAGTALTGILKLESAQRALVDVVVKAQNAGIKKRAFGELRDPRALSDLAKSEAAQDLRLAAVARIDDGDVLRALAIDTTTKEIGLAAVERIDDPDRLENVAAKAKNKAVRAKARKVVAEITAAERERNKKPGTPDEVKRRRAEKAQLVREIEALADTFDFAKHEDKVGSLEVSFMKAGPSTDGTDEGDDRFAKAVERFWKRKENFASQARSADELRAIEREAARERDAARAQKAEKKPDAPAADVVADPEAEAKREARETEAKARREEREAQKAEQDAKRAAQDAERDARKAAAAERGKELVAQLTSVLDELEALVANEKAEGRTVDRALANAGKAFDQIGKVSNASERDALAERYSAVRGKLVIRANEAREAEDWQRWANVPKAEACIATAKEWAEAESTPDLGNRLRELQKLWKDEVGPLPQKRSKELWDTFKTECDKVYEKVRGVRAVEAEKFGEVIKIKEGLIAEAEALATSTDFATTANRLKELQAQWKISGHLPRKQGDDLWTRFRAACDAFFERRKPMLDARHAEENDNLAKKHELIDRAKQIAAKAGEGTWGKAIGEIKDLQRAWKEIGFVPRRDADAVWQQFRAACDALFTKRDASRDAEANAHRAEVDALRTELEGVRAGGENVAARAIEVRKKAHELGVLGPETVALVQYLIEHHGEAIRGTELDPAQLRARRDKLIAKAEELLPKEQPEHASATDVAAQLKAAMQKNAFGDLRFSGRDPVEVIDELRTTWAEVGPVLDEADRAQQGRFEEVVARVLDASGTKQRRQRRERGDDAAPQATESVNEAVTKPANYPIEAPSAPVVVPVAAVVSTIPPKTEPLPPPPVRTKAASVAPAEDVDEGWDLGESDPTASQVEETPSSAEMAGDGSVEGDGLDQVD